jgi:hypothetical protein
VSDSVPSVQSYSKPQLRAIATEFFETRSEVAKSKLLSLCNDDWAWIAAQDDFKTFIIASQAKAALGMAQMTKSMQRAQDWFIKAASRPKDEKDKKRVLRGIPEVVPAEASGG